MSKKSFSTIPEDEISFREILYFLMEYWRGIFLAGVFGIIGASILLWAVPNQYQATAQIKMAQIAIEDNKTKLFGSNIEEPNLLVFRFKMPTTYSNIEIGKCDFEDKAVSFNDLENAVTFSVVKDVGSIVELKVYRRSKEVAIACAQSVFEHIKASQSQMVEPYIKEAQQQLLKYQGELNNSQALLSKADKSGTALSATYLAYRDEVKFLNEEVVRLKKFIEFTDVGQTKLISPIYVSDKPVLPKKGVILLVGLFAGLLLGLLYSLIRKTNFFHKVS